MKAKITGVITLVLVLGFVGMADADTVELDLFSLGCPTEFTFDNPYWQANFDLGTGFIEISHVYIDWSGGITAALVQQLDPQTLEPIGEPFPIDVGIYAGLSYPPLRITDIWGGQATYPTPEPFDCLSEIPAMSWADLLDGTNAVTLGLTEAVSPYGRYVEHGSILLDKATLVVEGIIPEPASIFLLAVGAFGLRARYLSHQINK